MAWDAQAKAAMEAAAEAANAEFDAEVKVSKAGQVTLPSGQWIVDWLARNKNTSGYRKLCRHIIQYATPAKE